MRLLLLAILPVFIWACSGPSGKIEDAANAYSIDTLWIDPGSSIINLEENLAFSGLSEDGSTLFHFDPRALKIQVINLKEARMETEVQFEKEGPNGIGDWHIGFQVLSDTIFALMGDNAFFLIDLHGRLQEKIAIDHLFYIQEDLTGKFSRSGFLFMDGSIYSNLDAWQGPSLKLFAYNPKEDTYKIKEIPGAENVLNSAMVTYIQKSSFYYYFGFSLVDVAGDLLIHHRTYPEIALYRVAKDSMQLFYPISDYYSPVPKAEKIKEVNGEEESDAYQKELMKQMSFLPPLWDPVNQRLYRWGYKMIPSTMEREEPEFENYLFILDKEFKIVEEFLIPEIRTKPHRIFLEGKQLFFYQNMDDELGFLRIKLKV